MNRLTCATALLVIAACNKAPGDGVTLDVNGGFTTPSSGSSVGVDGSSSQGWYPTNVSKSPFVPDERWPECIHPGVVSNCRGGWCRIPSGCYIFGSTENTPGRNAEGEEQGPITFTYEMEVMQTELTWAEYDRITGWPRKIYEDECDDDQCPAKVSWWEAMLFANLLSERHEPPLEHCYDLGEGCQREPGDRMSCPNYKMARPEAQCSGYRIPNQFEWQYLARGGTTTHFYTGDMTVRALLDCTPDPALEKIAWYCGNSDGPAAHHVAQLLPNQWGLYDLIGNVIETLQTPERRSPPYPATDPVELDGTGQRLTNTAGGNVVDSPQAMQVAKYLLADFAGLRLVRTLGRGTLPVLPAP